MKAAELLTIDVEAELRRLAEAGLEGAWQVPTELVRRAVAAGATRIEVELARHRVLIRDDGRPLAATRVRDLRRLLDPATSDAERHAALVGLEDEAELIAAAALRPLSVDVTTDGARGTTLVLQTRNLDVEAARRWLASCVRFAPAVVVLDGVEVADGFAGAWCERELRAPLSGRLALTREPIAHLWLLAHGVVSAHLTVPDTPAFAAAIEMAPAGAGFASPAVLREAVEPHLGALVDDALALVLEAAAQDEPGDELLRALRTRVLIAARRGLQRERVFAAPVLPVVVGPDGATRGCLALEDLGTDRVLPCLAPSDDPAEHLLPHGSVLVLDDDERGQLAPLLQLRFRPVQRRRVRAGGWARLRQSAASWASVVRRAVARLRHPRAGRVLAESALGADERAFLRAARAALPAGLAGVALTDGAAPPHRAYGRLHLPRRHPDVIASVRAYARDPAYLYVALLALVPDGAPSAESALGWRRMFG
jgi:hypothetical protein